MTPLASFFAGIAATLATEIAVAGVLAFAFVRRFSPMDDWKD